MLPIIRVPKVQAKEEAEAERLRRQAGVAAGAPKKPGPEATVYRRDPEPRRADETREEYVIRLTRQREAEAAAARRTQVWTAATCLRPLTLRRRGSAARGPSRTRSVARTLPSSAPHRR